MEREKPLPLVAFLGCAVTMISLLLVFGMNLYLTDGSRETYRSQPLANLVGIFLLIFGIILMGVGFRKSK